MVALSCCPSHISSIGLIHFCTLQATKFIFLILCYFITFIFIFCCSSLIQPSFKHLIDTLVLTHYFFSLCSFNLLCIISQSKTKPCGVSHRFTPAIKPRGRCDNERGAVSRQDGLEGHPSPPECWEESEVKRELDNLYTTRDKSWIWEVLTTQQLQSRGVKQPAPVQRRPRRIILQ